MTAKNACDVALDDADSVDLCTWDIVRTGA